MNDEIYVQLGDRLNESTFKVLPLSTGNCDLKEIFSEEEAALAAGFPGIHMMGYVKYGGTVVKALSLQQRFGKARHMDKWHSQK